MNEAQTDQDEPDDWEKHAPDCGCDKCWPETRKHHKDCYGSHCYMCGGCMTGGDDEPPSCSVCG